MLAAGDNYGDSPIIINSIIKTFNSFFLFLVVTSDYVDSNFDFFYRLFIMTHQKINHSS